MSLLNATGLKAVIFDVDGTLVDTTYLHAVSWAAAMRQFGHRVPMAHVHRCIGMGSDHLLDKLLPEDRDRSEDEALVASHAALMATHWRDFVELPDAVRLLAAVRARGFQVLLASSASGRDLDALLSALDHPDLDEVVTASDVERTKPDPDLLQIALERAHLESTEAAFVGDAVWDVHASKNLGIGCVGVTCGGTSAAELREAGADEVYAGPADLLAQVFSST
ncbi:MAG: family hydrolase [Marmoricola sp.]|jgi:HAD superfamily hydrolase (TIGR01509 family)|nr:family hydrolase [Marmoricola sp.]